MTSEVGHPPRIASVSADVVALDGTRRCLAKAKEIAIALGPLLDLDVPRRPDALADTPIFRALRRLHGWAQRGVGEAAAVEEALREVLPALLVRPVDAAAEAPIEELLSRVSERDPVGLVCLAAWARLQVARGARIDGWQLAALASLSLPQIRTLSRKGALRAATTPTSHVGTLYDAREVRRFLAERGVPGFDS